MAGKTRTLLLSLTVIAVMVFSAFGPTIAYADGGTPPESPPTAEATSQPEEVSTETTTETTDAPEAEATPAETAGDESESDLETSAPEQTEEAAPAESASEESEPTEEAAPAEGETAPVAEEPVLTEVPENTTVTVLDENGESQPLATQEAADAIAESDPIWCPEGASPTPGANGCTDSFSSFDELLTFLSGNSAYAGAGTIYVEQGAYQGNDPDGVVDFNAPTYDLSNIRNSNLTVTGGWNPGSGTVDPANTSNFTDTRIIIGSSTSPWGGSLTINNISMTFTDETPVDDQNGLTLHAQGDVALSNVSVSNAPDVGAEIDAGGGVTITDSKFHRNKNAGANIRAGGNVTIANSEFQNPRINRQRRQIVGANIESGGAVTLANVMASGNREEGVDIVAAGAVTIGNSVFSGMMEMVGPNDATEFLGFGLRVVTPSEINVDSVTANNNFLWGAWLDGGGPIAVANSIFNANTTESPGFIDDTGLFIYGDSIVSLFNVEANDNRLYGTYIEAAGNVSINESTFNNNRGITNTGGVNTFHGHGMYIDSGADILINNTDASGNMLFGGQLNAAGQVAISNSSFSNNSTGANSDALGKGLEIVSGDLTDLFNVTLNDNQTVGADITSGSSVMLNEVTATGNGTYGITLNAACAIVIGGTFSNNGEGGLFPDDLPTCSIFGGPDITGGGATNVFTSLQLAPESTTSQDSESDASSDNVSLNSFMGHTRMAVGGIEIGIFSGKYIYAYSDAGLQLMALAPSFDTVAMD